MATPQLVTMPRSAVALHYPSLARSRPTLAPQLRFHWEFWIICLIVSLGFVDSVPIGFYKFRISDLIVDLSLVYGTILAVRRRLPGAGIALLGAQVAVVALRVSIEGTSLLTTSALRTLLGMGAIYLTPVIFFVVRDSRVTRRKLLALAALSWVVSLTNQMGLLPRGEAYAGGMVDLAQILHISQAPITELDFMETSITVWRALSVGTTLAALAASRNWWIKALGAMAFVLQFGGGGGSRSPIIFAFVAPLVLYLRPGSLRAGRRVLRILVAAAVGTAMAAFYLWSPMERLGLVEDRREGIAHFERVTEVFVPFFQGWQTAVDSPGILNARVPGYQQYWEGIISSPRNFWLGVGLAEGAAFKDTPNVLAHNMILDVWALSGLVGLVLFLGFIAYVVRDLWNLLRITPDRGEPQFLGFTVAISVVFMFQWLLFQAATADRSFMIVFYLLAGLLRPTARWIEARRALGR